MGRKANSHHSWRDQAHLFTGYHTYRIPALAVSSRGTRLACAEGRDMAAAPPARSTSFSAAASIVATPGRPFRLWSLKQA